MHCLYDCNLQLIGLYKSESSTSVWYYNYVEAELISVMSVLFVYIVIITIIDDCYYTTVNRPEGSMENCQC